MTPFVKNGVKASVSGSCAVLILPVFTIMTLIFQQPSSQSRKRSFTENDVIDRVSIILRANLIFWNPENLILFKVFGTLSGRDQSRRYVSHRSSWLSSDNAFGRSSLMKFANNENLSF